MREAARISNATAYSSPLITHRGRLERAPGQRVTATRCTSLLALLLAEELSRPLLRFADTAYYSC
jgi:hypothetical protein